MSCQAEQRWSHRGSTLAGRTLFNPKRCGVAPITEAQAKAFVVRHHYSGSYPAALFRVGLFETNPCRLVGVAVFSVPPSQKVLPKYLGTDGNSRGAELGRFVLLDEVPYNAESWFLVRAFKALRKARPAKSAILAFSDPVPRLAENDVILPGHIGTIYQATNASYVGRSLPKTQLLTRSGTEISARLYPLG